MFPLLRRITENTIVANVIANEMHNLSAHAKFPNARFQSLLLIMSKIVAEIQFVYRKMGFSELIFFSLLTTNGSFGGDTSGIKQDWLLC